MLALLEALKHLHQDCGIIHGDVKPSNFVHDFGSNTFRLIDFGSAIEHRNKQITSLRGGTNGFKAPEILLHNDKEFRFGPAVDVWSAGIIMMSLLSGNENILVPCNRAAQSCNNLHLSEIGTIVGQAAMEKLGIQPQNYGNGWEYNGKTGWSAKVLHDRITRFGTSTWIPDTHALDLVSKMLDVRPSTRITCAQALEHPFFKTPSGLPNGMQWCYLNSVLQCLRQTTELTSQILSSSHTFQLIQNDPGYGIASKLRLFLTSDETKTITYLHELRRRLGAWDPKFNGASTECASEVCDRMLTAMFSAHCESLRQLKFSDTRKRLQ